MVTIKLEELKQYVWIKKMKKEQNEPEHSPYFPAVWNLWTWEGEDGQPLSESARNIAELVGN